MEEVDEGGRHEVGGTKRTTRCVCSNRYGVPETGTTMETDLSERTLEVYRLKFKDEFTASRERTGVQDFVREERENSKRRRRNKKKSRV